MLRFSRSINRLVVPGLCQFSCYHSQQCRMAFPLIEMTTLPADVRRVPGGIEGPPRKPPSAVEPEKTQDEDSSQVPQSGQAAVPPPFNPMDPDAKKSSRVAQWEEMPPRKREPENQHPAKLIPLTDSSLSVEFMNKLRGCTEYPEIKGENSVRSEMLKMINTRQYNMPLVSHIVANHKEGLSAALLRLSTTLESCNREALADCCSEALSQKITAIFDELKQADVKLVFDIEKITSTQLLAVDVITPSGSRHDALAGEFPYFQALKTDATAVEFEGCVETIQTVFIEERATSKVLFGSKSSMTAYHTLRFGSTLTPVSPPLPKTLAELKAWCNAVAVMSMKDLLAAARNPFKVAPWILLSIDDAAK